MHLNSDNCCTNEDITKYLYTKPYTYDTLPLQKSDSTSKPIWYPKESKEKCSDLCKNIQNSS